MIISGLVGAFGAALPAAGFAAAGFAGAVWAAAGRATTPAAKSASARRAKEKRVDAVMGNLRRSARWRLWFSGSVRRPRLTLGYGGRGNCVTPARPGSGGRRRRIGKEA